MDNGAHFRRCDFQVHTPRDINWKGKKPIEPSERRGYADSFVAACRGEGLGAVAITDHHDFAFFEFIKEAAGAELGPDGAPLDDHERLVVYPGLELTLAVPCQALLILDADFPTERLSSVLERLNVEAADSALPSTADPAPLAHIQDLKTLHEELDRSSWLKGHYIVLPNVTDGGHKTLMRKGMQDKYREMPCVGGYIDGEIAKKVGEGNERIFAGQDQAWGYKPIALFQTSDSRGATFADLGRHSTWVKWAEPTAEAIRQACLSQESRISHVQPSLPSICVTRLSVSNSKYMGPIELELNPQYNAIIGGRGTGKSTCLEYLRWALCDQPPSAAEADDQPDHAARRRRLIAETLQPFDATVDVEFVLNGIPHVVRRVARTGEVLLAVGTAELALSTADNIRSLLPIDAYSQKQLSSVAVRLDELTRFVKAPIRAGLEDIATKERRVAGQLRENYASLQRQRTLKRTITRDELARQSLQEQALGLRGELTDLSDDDKALLDKKPAFDAADEQVKVWLALIDEAGSELETLSTTIASLQEDALIEEDFGSLGDPIEKLQTAVSEALADVASRVNASALELAARRTARAEITQQTKTWEKIHAAFEAKYAEAKDRSTAHTSKLRELSELEQRRKALGQTLREQREELKKIGDPTTHHIELREQWVTLQRTATELLETQCEDLTKLSDGLIRASVRRSTGFALVSEKFRGAITGSGLRSNKIEAFFSNIAGAEDPIKAWQESLDELEGFLLADEDPAASTWSPASALAVFSTADLEKLRSRVTPEDVVELSLVPIEDTPIFEYRIKAGSHIAFEVASAGQQATALLRVLLNQSGPPLVIDQPEDDLDSQVMESVVDLIWRAKTRRQLIFSSHNANLVVNGDAELVACCDYRAANDQSGGRIKFEGAIDVPNVRKEITTVMEGGEKAFRLRKEKYGF
jgi:chromosome segregation protein